jgi:hypothetical protein
MGLRNALLVFSQSGFGFLIDDRPNGVWGLGFGVLNRRSLKTHRLNYKKLRKKKQNILNK